MNPELAETTRHELALILGLLQHAQFHSERRNLGAVDEALVDAVKRLHALLAKVRELS